MNIFAIGDLHLSGNPPKKPMQIFGEHWFNHWYNIREDWLKRVHADDVVLIAGDTSWALKLEEALEDLAEIISLPGKKILVKGNHDYWWQSIAKMSKAVDQQLLFVHNNFAQVDSFAICGSRGWTCPADPCFTEQDQVIYQREILRVQTSLSSAVAAGFKKIILMLHYPPVYSLDIPSGFADLFEEYQIELCVYGHLHGESIKTAPVGKIKGTACHLVACDALDFHLKQII